MKEELEQSLVTRYPELFAGRGKSPKESLMCFGCECGDGWYGILDNLFGFITDVRQNRLRLLGVKPEFATPENDGYIDFRCPQVVLDQVKEKYGTLRVYWHFSHDEIEELRSKVRDERDLEEGINRYSDLIGGAVDYSEYLSSNTCEVTGKPGKLIEYDDTTTIFSNPAEKATEDYVSGRFG